LKIAAEPDYEPASVTTPDNLIYVIYTSRLERRAQGGFGLAIDLW